MSHIKSGSQVLAAIVPEISVVVQVNSKSILFCLYHSSPIHACWEAASVSNELNVDNC